jgi:hypothetical protein
MTCATAPRASPGPLLVAALALGCAQSAPAAEPEAARRTLKGLTAFRVVVEKLGSTVENEGALQREALEADVEARLAQAGIPVSEDAPALLYASLAVVCHGSSCAFNIALEVQQRVRLAARPRAGTLVAPTWRTGLTGLVGRQPELIRQRLRDQVDQLVAAYRAANPAK